MIFIVYDISNRNSFKNLNVWISFIKSVNKDDSILVLVGNKSDLKREISQNEAKEIANKLDKTLAENRAKSTKRSPRVKFAKYDALCATY